MTTINAPCFSLAGFVLHSAPVRRESDFATSIYFLVVVLWFVCFDAKWPLISHCVESKNPREDQYGINHCFGVGLRGHLLNEQIIAQINHNHITHAGGKQCPPLTHLGIQQIASIKARGIITPSGWTVLTQTRGSRVYPIVFRIATNASSRLLRHLFQRAISEKFLQLHGPVAKSD